MNHSLINLVNNREGILRINNLRESKLEKQWPNLSKFLSVEETFIIDLQIICLPHGRQVVILIK